MLFANRLLLEREKKVRGSDKVALIPRPCSAFRQYRKAGDIFSHVSDVRIERMVERINCAWAHRTAKRAKVPGNLPHVSS